MHTVIELECIRAHYMHAISCKLPEPCTRVLGLLILDTGNAGNTRDARDRVPPWHMVRFLEVLVQPEHLLQPFHRFFELALPGDPGPTSSSSSTLLSQL